MAKRLLSTIILTMLIAVSLTACKGKKEPEVSVSIGFTEGPLVTTTESSVSASTETAVSSTETSDTTDTSSVSETVPDVEREVINLSVLISNSCKADIGMVCILDPYTGEQIQVGAIEDGKLMNMSYEKWPLDVTTLDIAFYNKNGDLVSSTEVDITGVKEKVTILLSGEGNIDNVKGVID